MCQPNQRARRQASQPPSTAGFSAADARELAKFRKSIGLNPLTFGGRRAWSALLSQGTTPHLRKGDHGKAVVRLQLALRSAGFVKVPTAGRYNVATVAVIKTVQKSRHLKQTGAVNADFWKALQAGKITATTVVVKKPTPKKPIAKPASTKKATKGEKALAYAKKQLGDPYRRRGTGPNGWDCSGLTMKAWQAAGVKLPIRRGSSTGSARRSPSPISEAATWSSSTAVSHMWGSMQATAR